MEKRQEIVPQARGRVLEIGIGSGLNLSFYDPDKVKKIWGLEPSKKLRGMAKKRVNGLRLDLEFIDLPGEEIPLDSNSMDTVLVTYTLCTIPGVLEALSGMRRVLKKGGELIFCEHGLAPDEKVRKWQTRLNPIWKKVSGGCHLDRHIPSLLEQGGFKIKKMETDYAQGWKPVTYNYWGSAIHD